IRRGDSGNITWLIQAALYTRGYTTVIPDGIFGPATDAAVREFQRDQGLTVDGVAGPNTQDRLFR
ncbi:MAG: peptidoglycan-binding protein, partial [Oscillospiraceae bacterium]|nr:peptidoglycan-binding protein [Oscillospiraceae bacterium]